MDLLYQRYADPYPLLEDMIRNRSLGRLVKKIISDEEKKKEEAEESRRWEFFLHKVIQDISYNDWKKSLTAGSGSYSMTKTEVEMQKGKAKDILKRFNPQNRSGGCMS